MRAIWKICAISKIPRIISSKGPSIADAEALDRIFSQYQPQGVIHLAAESHVDRSIANPVAFVETNVLGTVHLLNTARKHWA
jgi:dTDP-glucose 4,6-dehydratase